MSADDSSAAVETMPAHDFSAAKASYTEYCAGCHGEQMQAFVDRKWKYGKSDDDLFKAIKEGYTEDGMPSYDTTFTDEAIHELVAYIQTGIANVDQYQFEEAEKPTGVIRTEEMSLRLDTVVSGLSIPWGMTFLPDGDLLFTEREGALYRFTEGSEPEKISGLPEVLAMGQGGLLDVELHPQFATNNWIYLSYSKPKKENGETLGTTAVMRAKLVGNQLSEQEVIFEALPYSKTRHHYGSRLEFDPEGYLFISVGDRGNRDQNPQNLDNYCGKIHRVYDDGRIPEDNPFVNQAGAVPSIYSYGHRNPQGLSRHPQTGVMWDHEHGPRGGDEVNRIEKGKNYGWPVISYGINYNGTTFTNQTEAAGMEQPDLYWVPSIAPCGSTFVTGDSYPAWKGDLLVGSLRFKYLNRCIMEDGKIIGEEKLFKNIGRIRAVEMGRDGYIYVSVENPGIIFRVVPVNS
jgi:glucose/arabinose dehydrogenase